MHLFRIPGDRPAAWVAPAIVTATDDAVLTTVLDPRFDVHSVALMTDSATVESAELSVPPESLDLNAEVIRYEPGRIDVRLAQPAPEGSALVVSENYYPGWQATVNGQPTELWRTNYTLIGVPLPVGATDISLEFSSRPYEIGRVVTIVALLVSAALLAGGAMMDRRVARA